MDTVVGFTNAQREWFILRDGGCQFHWFDLAKMRWVRCPSKTDLQVHHIVPRGWATMHLPVSFQLNGSHNGICLCKYHHVGKGSVHPDTYEALLKYQAGNKNAYKQMMEARRLLNEQGTPYWCTKWDWMFSRIARKATAKFVKTHPYPINGNRGNTGRVGGLKYTRSK